MINGINHIDLFSRDPVGLRGFYLELLGAEPLEGYHDPLRAGSVQLAFHELEEGLSIGGTEIAFDVTGAGFDQIHGRASRLGVVDGAIEDWNGVARSFYVHDPDRRRVEFSHHDHGVFWRA